MASPPTLALQEIGLGIGRSRLLDGASLAIGAGERLCLVGRNGSGKSTLLRIAAGEIEPDRGSRFVQPGVTIRVLPQEPDVLGHANVLDYVRAGAGPADDPHRAMMLLEELALDPGRTPETLSGGEARKAALVRALAPAPDILLLDEPTNHLDLPSIEWLERTLAAERAGIVLISHDRRLLERVARHVVWLDSGITRRLDRGFAAFEEWRDGIIADEEQQRHKLGRQIAREEDWLRYGVTARRKRNVRRVADLASLRERRREATSRPGTAKITSADAGLSGRLVAVASAVTFAWPGQPPAVCNLDLRILRGDRLGIVGPNGAGKSTLLGLLTGAIVPASGTIEQGASRSVATLDQLRQSLDGDRTLADTLTGGAGDSVTVDGEKRHVVGVLKDFLFKPEQARSTVSTLSGGERGRLALATALLRPSNLLVLDEPTNDLDLETLDLLVELVGAYKGTVLVVSHDRDFLDRVATSVLLAEGDGRWVEYAGGWSDMLAQRGGRSPFAAGTTPVALPQPTARPGATGPAPSRKLSFKDAHLLGTLPARIEEIGAEIASMQRLLDDPDLFRTDPGRFAAATASLARATGALAVAEEQWLELEIRREAIADERRT